MSDGMTREERAWCSGVTADKPTTHFRRAVLEKNGAFSTDDIEDLEDERLQQRFMKLHSLPEEGFIFRAPTKEY